MMTSAKEAIMRTKWIQPALLLAGLAAMCGTAAYAQTDVAGSLYETFTATTNNNNGSIQSSSNAAGGLLEVRHIAKPWAGYEGTYAYNRANQVYTYPYACASGLCPSPIPVPANAHEVTGDWVASVKAGRIRPFALAGGGIFIDAPSVGQVTFSYPTCSPMTLPPCVLTTGTASTNTSVKPVFVYGAGVDWKLLPHIGLRLQYRGNLYKAPYLTTLSTTYGITPSSYGALTYTAEPMIGVYFRL
jgi:hypothetical protein